MTKVYTTRNSFYIRISKSTVLPMYLYLDERHISWMSDVILQHVLADLRPFILPKLRAEAGDLTSNQKPSTVETYRGDTYQFCYFLRKTEPHSVVIKNRNFHTVLLAPQVQPAASSSKRSRGKDKQFGAKKRRRTRKDADIQPTSDEEDEDAHMGGDGDRFSDPELEIDEQEEKPKPRLRLNYTGFNIYGQCLCVVVEPFPNADQKQASSDQSATASTSRQARAQTPLFLADEPEEHGLIRMVDDESDELQGMLSMTQALRSGGDTRTGAINDDEDIDGFVLFGDADEIKEF